MGTTLQFLGATRTVTGSKHVLNHRGKVVMMDCGMFQGLKDLRLKNWEPFPLPPGYVDDIVLTHAHMDHAGFLPRLARQGFGGRVFCTPSTSELCAIMLPDSAHIQEEDARYANKEGFSKHSPAMPLYTLEDVQEILGRFQAVPLGQPFAINKNVTFDFLESGHILGSACARFTLRREDGSEFKLVFTGDLGRYNENILPDPAPVEEADFLIIESTYGDRLHADGDVLAALEDVIRRTAKRKGILLIPSFAVGRTQELLYHLRVLQDERRIPLIPVYVDSPLAIQATRIFCRHPEALDLEHEPEPNGQDCALLCDNLHLATAVQDSMAINKMAGPLIILSASGMCEAGRVLHHLKLKLPDRRNTVLFVGYQAEGTRGRRLQEGEKEIKIHGELVPVRAEIQSIEAFSAHADYEEIFHWLGGFRRPPRMTFLVHGEPSQMESLAGKIRDRLGWAVQMPKYLDKVDLDALLPPLSAG